MAHPAVPCSGDGACLGWQVRFDEPELTLHQAEAARTIMRGWWPDLPTAERKYLRWIGERGTVNGARTGRQYDPCVRRA
ncbi:hypothetical protein [Streptomyces sp. NBC_00893]|uniref:hypothetical protein n=1 Tax=Streptomyces sp. NBC_00893 TaxID=2975862 RepID=UPI00225870BD|nr:hypothetical protein [Streptomyces sp. NBC_00893]MCX4851700.1 hypothetical protein [Streptomyces sp. NBC_00893]